MKESTRKNRTQYNSLSACHALRSTIARKKAAADYLERNPAKRIPFVTRRIQKPVVEALETIKRDGESWGACLSRVLKEAGYSFQIEL